MSRRGALLEVHDLARFLGVDEPTPQAVIVVGDDAALVGLAVGRMRGIARPGERSPTPAPHRGVAAIVEVMTDNRNRTASDVRSTFTKHGGNLAETGAVSFMFDHLGVIEFEPKAATADQMFEAALEAGADDVVSGENGHEIYAAQDKLREVAKALEQKFGEPRKAALTWKPQNTIALDDEQGEKVLKLMESLEDHDDVQNVYANFEVSDALVQKMSA